MLKPLLLTVAALWVSAFSFAQNTFPASGNVGIGTTIANSALTINGGALNIGTNSGQYSLNDVDNRDLSVLKIGSSLTGLNAGDFMLRSFWGVSIDLNDGLLGDNNSAPYTRIPNTSSFTINSRSSQTGFNTLLTVRNNGNVGIGTTDPKGYKLAVAGNVIAESVTVKLQSQWPDFVFKPTYTLPSLKEVKDYIDRKGHLPDMPSEAEAVKEGINLGEMNKKLLQKVEELTLYLIEKDKQVKKLEHQQSDFEQFKSQVMKQLLRKCSHKKLTQSYGSQN